MKRFAPTSETPRRPAAAFTLIELLVVIAIIGLLAGMLFPIAKAVNRAKIRSKAKVELAQVQTAIEAYKMKLGHYPPDNPGEPPFVNQLYFELVGTTVSANTYTAERRYSITLPNAAFPKVSGIVNCTRSVDEESARAVKFATALRDTQVRQITSSGVTFAALVSSVLSRMPDGTQAQSPVRYLSTNPAYNKNSFDLWIDVVFEGKTNRFSNWSSAPVIVYEPGI